MRTAGLAGLLMLIACTEGSHLEQAQSDTTFGQCLLDCADAEEQCGDTCLALCPSDPIRQTACFALGCATYCADYHDLADRAACQASCQLGLSDQVCFADAIATSRTATDGQPARADLACLWRNFQVLALASSVPGTGAGLAADHLENFLFPRDPASGRGRTIFDPLPPTCAGFAKLVADADGEIGLLPESMPPELKPGMVCAQDPMDVPADRLVADGFAQDLIRDTAHEVLRQHPALPYATSLAIAKGVDSEGRELEYGLGRFGVRGTLALALAAAPAGRVRVDARFDLTIHDTYDWQPSWHKGIMGTSFLDAWPALLTACGLGCEFAMGGTATVELHEELAP